MGFNKPIALTVGILSVGVIYFAVVRKRKGKKEIGANAHADQCEQVEDFEDLASLIPSPQDEDAGVVLQRIAKRRDCETAEDFANVPGTQSIYVKTFGCSHNVSDSEVMMGQLQSYGYRFASSLEEADICLINSCTVKNPSQEAMITVMKKAQERGKACVVAGCVPQADRYLKGLERVSLLGTSQIHRVVEVVENALAGNVVRMLAKGNLPSLDIPKVRRNQYVEIIPISSGCLGACSYCKTKQARGHLGSYAIDAILNRMEVSIKEGIQQIWMTSEDTGAYGIDFGSSIAELLEKAICLLEQTERRTGRRIMLRLGMTNPPFILQHVEKIKKILAHRNAFKFIHIPVQSGSTKVLHDMVREYTVEDFELLADALLARDDGHVSVATDIICGFPTEKPSDHEATIKLIEKYKFPILNISKFYPRPGTAAARMKRVPTNIVKQRSREVTQLYNSYSCNDFLLNSFQRVWFSETQLAMKQTVGHTKHFIKVVVPLDFELLGTDRWVKIVKVTKWHAEGEVLINDYSKEKDEIYMIQ